MKFDFSDENFEKARIHYREASKKHVRALKLYESGDYAGCVESSQHAIELYIKTLFVQSGNKIPKIHDPSIKIDPIIKELKRINSELLKNAKIDIFTRIKFISNQVNNLHTTAMYGLDGTPPSLLFTQEDAVYYYSLAQEILFSILLIAFQFGYYFENIPEEGREFLNAAAPGFYVKNEEKEERQNLAKCLSHYLGKWITPPRNKVFDINAQRYRLNVMNNDEKYLEIQFESGTKLRVHYWRFNHVIDLLLKAGNEYIPVGTRINPEFTDTIQGSLYYEAITKGHGYANLRIASYVCDMIVLCGYAEYGYTINQRTERKVQGIRKTAKLN